MATITKDDVVDVGDDLDIPFGDNEQVLGLAAVQNMGKALSESDLYPTGANYLLHQIPNVLQIYVHKETKDNFWFVCDVYDHAIADWKENFEKKKTMTQASTTSEGAIYDVPIWIIFDLALNQGVHPLLDEKEFEQVLWDIYPELWIREDKAPKRLIK